MNQSSDEIEKLLRQLPLQQPSSELDARVSGVCDSNVCADHRSGFRWSQAVVLACVSVASLLLGIFLGQTFASPAAAETVAGGRYEPPTELEPVSQGEAGNGHVPDDLSSAALSSWASKVSGPKVSLLCSVRQKDSQAEGDIWCRLCHSGLEEASVRFVAEHVQHPACVACSLCHETRSM